ncbi:hypothetical protein MMEU_5004 [Mycobacterium marinum str. Europe]|nr:hypothetical protein MMEU_5004 [Mycobacterium marinum str. Europe]
MLSWTPNISSAIMAVQRRYTLPNQSQQVPGWAATMRNSVQQPNRRRNFGTRIGAEGR